MIIYFGLSRLIFLKVKKTFFSVSAFKRWFLGIYVFLEFLACRSLDENVSPRKGCGTRKVNLLSSITFVVWSQSLTSEWFHCNECLILFPFLRKQQAKPLCMLSAQEEETGANLSSSLVWRDRGSNPNFLYSKRTLYQSMYGEGSKALKSMKRWNKVKWNKGVLKHMYQLRAVLVARYMWHVVFVQQVRKVRKWYMYSYM